MGYAAYSYVYCLVQLTVLVVNALAIWAACRLLGDREKGFGTALIVSFIEIIALVIINAALIAPALFYPGQNLVDWEGIIVRGNPEAGLEALSHVVFLHCMNIFLIGCLLTVLIKRFYGFDYVKSFLAAAVVVFIDIVLGLMVLGVLGVLMAAVGQEMGVPAV
jgi:hypothetical protein